MRGKAAALVVLALVVLAPAVARAGWREDFVGWSYDGKQFAYDEGNGCESDGYELCRVGGGDCDPGGYFEASEVVAPIAVPRPAGVEIAVHGKKLVVSAGGKQVSKALELHEAARTALVVKKVAFAPGDRAVAVTVEYEGKIESCAEHEIVEVFAVDVTPLHLEPPAANHARARARNIAGLAAMREGKWQAAIDAFGDAIGLDESFVIPHYNLASAASINGDVATVRRELRWLHASHAGAARRALAHGKTDPDLDFASIDPEVRTLLGEPPLPAAAADLVTERDGVWSSDGVTCKRPSTILTFAKGGTLMATLLSECKGKRTTRALAGHWSAGKKPGTLDLQLAKATPGLAAKATLGPVACDYYAAGDTEAASGPAGSCLTVAGGRALFRRGIPLAATK
jgi:hypothetical protein